MTARRIAIVPHTHWDREWYKSYQDFRLNLVDLVDTLIPLLERDPSYQYFMLDGQMAVVDDYLEVRPHAEEHLRALAAAGRVSMGPWYILMDEFLSSGETIIRNLQLGLRRGAAFGGSMEIGYLPDMFGHIAQMPQILRLAGLSHAVVWRGVPSQVTKNAFVWEAPDGSAVRTEYLPVGYGNGAALPDDAKALVRRTLDNVAEVEDFLLGDLLVMNGSDHLMPQPALGRVIAEANDLQDEFEFEVTSLSRYLERARASPPWSASCARDSAPTC
jgi:2-O-(6-phospho-alpha-D-mannosyl)-D-glycerate hydrolase